MPMSPSTEKIVVAYLSNSISISDLNKLSQWIENDRNKELFKSYVKTHFAIISSLNDAQKHRAINRLLQDIRKEKSLIYSIKKHPIYRSAAATVLLLITLAVFLKNGEAPTVIKQSKIANTNPIEAGTNKATLTLEDGSQIALKKGMSFQTPNANSDGEQLIYQGNTEKNKKIIYNYLTVPRGGQFYVVLADGTKVWLNSESQLKYPIRFLDGETRQVELVYGEAYFEVASSSENNGTKFIVVNKSQEVAVFGTAFNIKAYKDETDIYTTLVEGKVSIVYDGKKQNLIPSYQSILNVLSSEVTVTKVDVSSEVSWKNGVFSFRSKPLHEIMKVISRWYDIDVVFENKALEHLKFRGELYKTQNINEIMTIMKSTTINSYEIIDRTIIIR